MANIFMLRISFVLSQEEMFDKVLTFWQNFYNYFKLNIIFLKNS